MSMISIGIDTKTRTVVMTVDGTIVPCDSVYLTKSQDFDGKPFLRFEYTTRATGQNGLEEIHGYFLPPPEQTDASAKANAQGFVEQPVVDANKAIADIQAFFAQSKCGDGKKKGKADCQPGPKDNGSPEMRDMMKKKDNGGC